MTNRSRPQIQINQQIIILVCTVSVLLGCQKETGNNLNDGTSPLPTPSYYFSNIRFDFCMECNTEKEVVEFEAKLGSTELFLSPKQILQMFFARDLDSRGIVS